MPLRTPGSLPVRIGLYVGAGLIALWVGLRIMAAIPGQGLVQVYQAHHRVPVPVEVPVTKTVTRWKTRTVEVPVVIMEPSPKEVAKIEKETGLDIPSGERVLGVHEIPRAPNGGFLYAGLRESGEPHFTFVEKKPPLIRLGGPWEVAAGAQMNDELRFGWLARVSKELATVKGNTSLAVEVNVGQIRGDSTDVRAAAYIRWRP